MENKTKKPVLNDPKDNRREFISKSAAGAFALALSAIYGTRMLNAQEKTQAKMQVAKTQIAPVKAGTFQITDEQAKRLNNIRSVLMNAMQTRDIKSAMARYGKDLSNADKITLSQLTTADLKVLSEINNKLDFGGEVADIGVTFW